MRGIPPWVERLLVISRCIESTATLGTHASSPASGVVVFLEDFTGLCVLKSLQVIALFTGAIGSRLPKMDGCTRLLPLEIESASRFCAMIAA
jgi:hypothetical protein